LVLGAYAKVFDQRLQTRLQHEAEVEKEQRRPATPKMSAERSAFSGQEGRTRAGGDDQRALRGNLGPCRKNEPARLVALALERAAQPPDAVPRHLHQPR